MLLAGCAGTLCARETVGEAYTPGGGYEAVTLVENCGATSPYVTLVAILPEGTEEPEEEDFVFSATSENRGPGGPAPAGPGRGPKVSTEWVSDAELVISYDPRARTYIKETSQEGVAIEYEEVEDPA